MGNIHRIIKLYDQIHLKIEKDQPFSISQKYINEYQHNIPIDFLEVYNAIVNLIHSHHFDDVYKILEYIVSKRNKQTISYCNIDLLDLFFIDKDNSLEIIDFCFNNDGKITNFILDNCANKINFHFVHVCSLFIKNNDYENLCKVVSNYRGVDYMHSRHKENLLIDCIQYQNTKALKKLLESYQKIKTVIDIDLDLMCLMQSDDALKKLFNDQELFQVVMSSKVIYLVSIASKKALEFGTIKNIELLQNNVRTKKAYSTIIKEAIFYKNIKLINQIWFNKDIILKRTKELTKRVMPFLESSKLITDFIGDNHV
jgi:hypothetical protein